MERTLSSTKCFPLTTNLRLALMKNLRLALNEVRKLTRYRAKEKNSIKVGDRVFGEYEGEDEGEYCEYDGTVYAVIGENATIKRDDEIEGGGVRIPNYGGGWEIEYDGYGWGADNNNGELYVIKKKVDNWKEIVMR